MKYRALDVFIGTEKKHVGLLFQYGEGRTAITRLKPDLDFWNDDQAPILSLAALVEDKKARATYLAEYATQPFFNGEGEDLPCFFQNMLPEGPLRRHLEQLGKLEKNDHFALLSLCGTDLPGAVYVAPADIRPDRVEEIVTQKNDALEPSVTPFPVPEATSLSGVQPKISLVASSGRYVARTKDVRGIHIIAKLPTVEFPLLPQVEELSTRLAAAAGVQVCELSLAPLEDIQVEQPFVLGEGKQFLAVRRFDRTPEAHVHCEDFAQILGVPPEQKYTHALASYANMLTLLMTTPGLGPDAAHELLRRIVVNDLLGNFDGHLKNFGLLYRDGSTPELSPAYDIVAYACYLPGRGHALRFVNGGPTNERITPKTIRSLSNEVPDFLEPKAASVVKDTVRRAYDAWPDMIEASSILPVQKQRLLTHFYETPAIQSLAKRAARKSAFPSSQ